MAPMVCVNTNYLTKARPMWASLCQREAALREAGKGMQPYVVEGWQGARVTSMCSVLRRLVLTLLFWCVLLIFASQRSAKANINIRSTLGLWGA